MFYQKELDFIKSVLKKSNVEVTTVNKAILPVTDNLSYDLFDNSLILRKIFPELSHKKLYKLEDSLSRRFRFFLLPNVEEATIFCIGPYLTKSFSREEVLEIAEKTAVNLQNHTRLLEYYYSLPVLQENSPLFTVLNTFCEIIWQTPNFETVDISNSPTWGDAPFSKTMLGLEYEDTIINKKAIERRYAFENELIRAVSLGQSRLQTNYNSEFLSEILEKRTSDPLQNAKNYSIIMNTLLRKGAEQGGVHPVYLDQTSSEYAKKIESLNAIKDGSALMNEMFQGYCRLVQKHSVKKYTQIVQNVILIIDADLSADLSPKLLAKNQGVTLGYLSTVFKKETGKTISEYVRTRRMEYAEHLLKTTNLQIQTIALHCGIMDAQYFTKQFKAYYGQTPFEFRRQPFKRQIKKRLIVPLSKKS